MLTQVDLLKKYGLSVRGRLGQHILIDPNIQRKVVERLDIKPSDKILEIGAGLGALTGHLLGRSAQFTAIEMDPQFVRILKEEFAAVAGHGRPSDFDLIHADILKWDPRALQPAHGRSKWKVIGNLPYYITAPIIFRLLEYRELFSKFVLTLQKEVADRLLALPGSKDYGRLTLALRYAGRVRHAFDIPRTCFTPQPAVGSSVVVIDLYPQEQLLKKQEEERLFYLIQAAFRQRRKMFLSLLAGDSKIKKGRRELEAVFQKLGIPFSVRGEALLLKDYLALADALR